MVNHRLITNSGRRLFSVALLGWLSMLGFDFFLHAGLLAGLYQQQSPFLLAPLEAFRRIPIGYIAFFLMALLLVWLMTRMEITGWREGLVFGLKLGALIWAALALGLFSVSTADIALLLGWFGGQTIELGIAGAVVGSGLISNRLTGLSVKVIAFVLVLLVITIIMQTVGIAPAARI